MNFHKFDSFSYNSTKIIPTLSSDWHFSYSTRPGYILIQSLSLSQDFFVPEDIFFSDIQSKNIDISYDQYLLGTFIFSKDKHIYTESEYISWLEKVNSLKSNSISKKDLVPGSSYILDNDRLVFFLGTKYVSTFKGKFSRSVKSDNLDFSLFTPIRKRFLFSDLQNNTFEIHNRLILKESSKKISSSKINRLLHSHNLNNPFIAFFRDDCPVITSFFWDFKLNSFSSNFSF